MASPHFTDKKEDCKCKDNVKSTPSIRNKKKKDPEKYEFVAPDGGWGWVVTVACGMSNFSTLPVGQNFGLIYKEKYEEWGITQAEYSFMRNLEFSISSVTGLFSGALLNRYGFRKMSIIGGILYAISILITSQITSITYFTMFFAILGGIGTGIGWPSNALALNTYFKKRRGIATGFSWTATGLSPVLMPQLINLLMQYYDVHGTVLILAGIALHSVPAALLLQPVHWHGKWVKRDTEQNAEKIELRKSEEKQAVLDVPHFDEHVDSKHRKASLRNGQVEGIEEDGDYIVDTQSTLGLDVTAPISRHSSLWSLRSEKHRPTMFSTQNLAHKFEECDTVREEECPMIVVTEHSSDTKNTEKKDFKEADKISISSVQPTWKKVLNAVVNFFDLTIMKDPKFVVIFIGMTLAFAAEVNFALFVPFIFAEYGFEKDRVAHYMTMLASMDLVTRFTVPFLTDKLKLDPKVCYSVGLLILASGRIVLAHGSGFYVILAATLWMGFGKGLRTVYMALVIPSYVPLHRLPTASGLQMLANGVVFMTIGPVFGYLRDNSDTYAASLHSINALTFTAVGLWAADGLVSWCSKKISKRDGGVDVTSNEKNTE